MAFSYDNNNEIFALQGARRAKTSFSWQPACGELTLWSRNSRRKVESGGGSGTPPRPVSMALTLSADADKATVATVVVLVASGSTMSPGASLTGGVKVAPGGRKEQS
jgi:hypothetical protein